MKKVLMFSRHSLTKEQVAALTAKLGEVEVTQISGSPANIHVAFDAQDVEPDNVETAPRTVVPVGTACKPLKELCKEFDETVCVLPANMLEQLTNVGIKPLRAIMSRTTIEGGNTIMTFVAFERIMSIKTIVEPF